MNKKNSIILAVLITALLTYSATAIFTTSYALTCFPFFQVKCHRFVPGRCEQRCEWGFSCSTGWKSGACPTNSKLENDKLKLALGEITTSQQLSQFLQPRYQQLNFDGTVSTINENALDLRTLFN